MGRRAVHWNEVFLHFGNTMPKEAIVHAWNDRSVIATAVGQGYNVINSQGWYLDSLGTNWDGNPCSRPHLPPRAPKRTPHRPLPADCTMRWHVGSILRHPVRTGGGRGGSSFAENKPMPNDAAFASS